MNSRRLLGLIVGLAVLDHPATARAQVPAPVGPGALVRWRGNGSDSYSSEGRIVWIRSDSLSASAGSTSLTLSRAAHPELQVRSARRSHLRGAMIGLGSGAAFGIGLGLIAGGCTPGKSCFVSQGQVVMGSGVVFGFVGLLVGAVVNPGYQWTPLPQQPLAAALQVRPLLAWSHGPAMGISVQF